jgi:predicted dehydrogenase
MIIYLIPFNIGWPELMMASGTIDAVIMSTPHYDHSKQAILAL